MSNRLIFKRRNIVIILSILLGLSILFWIRVNIKLYNVKGESMYPTLHPRDLVIVKTFDSNIINRDAIVVLVYPYKNWDKWDKIEPETTRYHIKRVIGLPKDTVSIRDGQYLVNSFDSHLGDEFMQKILSENRFLNLTIDSLLPFAPENVASWSIFNMDPIIIPCNGLKLRITERNYNIYKRIIEWETGCISEFRDNVMIINNQMIAEYTFEYSYYFLGGDNVLESIDSRFWGLIPESFIIGTVFKTIHRT